MKDVRTSPSIPHAEYFPQQGSSIGPGHWWRVVRGDARELTRFWPVIQNMVSQDLRIRYHRSMLGFLWTLINPILITVDGLVLDGVRRLAAVRKLGWETIWVRVVEYV